MGWSVGESWQKQSHGGTDDDMTMSIINLVTDVRRGRVPLFTGHAPLFPRILRYFFLSGNLVSLFMDIQLDFKK